MQSAQYRSYKSHVPDYLKDRPKNTIIHCLERKSKALKYSREDMQVIDNDKGIFTIKGSKDKVHKLNLGPDRDDGMPSCTCGDWQQWHIPCKHMFAIFNLQTKWSWNTFHADYLNSAYLSIDTLSLDDYFNTTNSLEPANDEQDCNDNSPTECHITPNPDNHTTETELPKHKVCTCKYVHTCIHGCVFIAFSANTC